MGGMVDQPPPMSESSVFEQFSMLKCSFALIRAYHSNIYIGHAGAHRGGALVLLPPLGIRRALPPCRDLGADPHLNVTNRVSTKWLNLLRIICVIFAQFFFTNFCAIFVHETQWVLSGLALFFCANCAKPEIFLAKVAHEMKF